MTKTTQYKNTPIGPIPKDWKVKKLGDLTNITAGGTPSTTNPAFWGGNIRWMNSGELNLKFVYEVEGRITDEGLKSSSTKIIPLRSILIGLAGQGKTRGTVAMNMIELCTNQSIASIYPSENFNEYFLYHNLDSRYNEIRLLSTGDGGRGGLNLAILKSLQIPLPPLPEQQKIAEVLSTWDKAIQETDAIIKKLQDRNKALAFSLLTGKKRVKGFEGKWRNLKIKEVFSEVKDINDGNDVHKVLTISAKNGFVSQEDKFDRVIAGNSLKKYTLLKKGDFAYNKGNSKTYEYGCIYVLDKYPSALVPFVYICFRPTLEISIDFYRHWFFNHSLDNQLRRIITSGARGDGLLNVSKDDFFNLKVVFPSLEEQNAIAEILNTANQEVKQYQQKLEALKLQKKGLMQQLLTGKVRTV